MTRDEKLAALVERMRVVAEYARFANPYEALYTKANDLAAILAEPDDEVDALRHDIEQYQVRQGDMLGEVERLRAALDDITRGGPTVDAVLRGEWESVAEWMRGRAEAALQAQRGE